MRPFFKFYGGKWRDAVKNYPAPEHKTVVEPFAGSAGYSVRYHDRNVVLYDLDPVICGVWDYLIKVTPAEVLAIPDVPEGGTVADLDIPQEARWLVGFWLNAGSAGPCLRPSSWMRSGIQPGTFWGTRARRTIASQVEGIRHWRIVNASFEEAKEGAATWFVDPPYQQAGKHYRFGSKGLDFQRLGEWCKSRQGQVIACEGPGADWLPFSPLADIRSTRPGRWAKEVAWIREASP